MKEKTSTHQPDLALRVILFVIAILMLASVYLFQRVNPVGKLEAFTGHIHPYVLFIINRVVRLVFNDLACFLMIYVFFRERKYLKVAFWLFLLELLIILPLYFMIKLTLEGASEISSPLLSQFHRLIVNPTLMLLLMAGFFYQRNISIKM